MFIFCSRWFRLHHGKFITSQSCFCFGDGIPSTFAICSTRRAVARSVSSTPRGHVGVRWRAGDVPRLLVTLNRACSMGLTTVGVAGRPGGGAGGDSFCINLVDTNGATCWRKCLMRIESLLNIAGVRVSSPAKNCLMSMVGVSSSLNNTASSLMVDVIVGPSRSLCSSSILSAICTPLALPCWRKYFIPAPALLAVRGGRHIIMVV